MSISPFVVGAIALPGSDSNPGFVPLSHRMTATIMLETLYGYTPSPHKVDPLVAQIGQVMNEFSEATAAGSWLVDLFPILRYVPEWVPGAEFKRTAKAWNKSHLYSKQRSSLSRIEPLWTCLFESTYSLTVLRAKRDLPRTYLYLPFPFLLLSLSHPRNNANPKYFQR